MKSTTRGTLTAVVTAVAAVAGAAAATPAVAADHDLEAAAPLFGNTTAEVGTRDTRVVMPFTEQSVPSMVSKDLRPMPKGAGALVGVLPHLLVPQAGKTMIQSKAVTAEPGRVALDMPEMPRV